MEFVDHVAASAALTTLNQRLFLEKVSAIDIYVLQFFQLTSLHFVALFLLSFIPEIIISFHPLALIFL